MFEKTVLPASKFRKVISYSKKPFRMLPFKKVTFMWNTDNASDKGLGTYLPVSFAEKMYETLESNVRVLAIFSNLIVFWETEACSPFKLTKLYFKGETVDDNYCAKCYGVHPHTRKEVPTHVNA